METIINLQSFDKKVYQRPVILQELLLETKAGSVIPPFPWPPAGGEPVLPKGDFPINNEP